MSQKLIIRTSDTGQFRRCRVKWDFSSKIRMGYELTKGVEPLDFGTAVHEGMEILYDPQRWDENSPGQVLLKYEEAKLAFRKHMDSWKARMMKTGAWEMEKARWKDLVTLGNGMFDHYQTWAPEQDKTWTPVYAEVEFELPIPVPEGAHVPKEKGFRAVKVKGLTGLYLAKLVDGELKLVLFQGRIDVVVQEDDGYWIVDHKTAASLQENVSFFDMDAQAGRYCWALKQQLGIEVNGVIFNQMRKKVPDQPDVLKSGMLSKNKAQKTTPAIYKAAYEELGHDPAYYAEFLERFSGQEYFRRVTTYRTREELRFLGGEIYGEAIDMLGDPFIYRNPSQFECNSCQFKSACIMRYDGSDWEWFLAESGQYTKRN